MDVLGLGCDHRRPHGNCGGPHVNCRRPHKNCRCRHKYMRTSAVYFSVRTFEARTFEARVINRKRQPKNLFNSLYIKI